MMREWWPVGPLRRLALRLLLSPWVCAVVLDGCAGFQEIPAMSGGLPLGAGLRRGGLFFLMVKRIVVCASE
jgi:hypothetical protein